MRKTPHLIPMAHILGALSLKHSGPPSLLLLPLPFISHLEADTTSFTDSWPQAFPLQRP